MKILGIDPGFSAIGFALVDFQPTSTRVLHHETFQTSTRYEPGERLDAIADRACDIIERWQPSALGYENQAGVAVGKAERDIPVTAASQRVIEVCGLIRAAARFNAVPCYVVAINTVKVAVLGKGGARRKKADVKAAVRTIFRLGNCSEHVADAVAIAVATRSKHRKAQMVIQAAAHVIH
jgi:Holliday junction resolvasome RuvABC endonuclease subunit